MYTRTPLPETVLQRAGRQSGAIARAQLVVGGLTDSQIARLVSSRQLSQLDHALYYFGVEEPTWRVYAWSAVLVGGRNSRLMARSAGAIEGLCPESLPIELAVPLTHGLRSRSWLRVVRESPGVRSSSSTGAPARTLVEDTVLDLCAGAKGEAEVIGFLTTAAQRHTTPRRLMAALTRRHRMRHRQLIAEVLAEVKDGAGSPLELRWIKGVERPHQLPPATRPYRLAGGQVADGAWVDFKVLLELDGRAYHDGERRFRDWRRDNVSSEDGWVTLRYGWHDTVVDPCAAAGNAARVLRQRGWTRWLKPCRNCP